MATKVLGIFYILHSLGEGQEELLNVVNEMKRKMEDIDYSVLRKKIALGKSKIFCIINKKRVVYCQRDIIYA